MDNIVCEHCGAVNSVLSDACVECGELIETDQHSDVGSFRIVNAIAGSLNEKEKHKSFTWSLGKPWSLGNAAAIDFVKKIEGKFRRKNKLHGHLEEAPGGIAGQFDGFSKGDIPFLSCVEFILNFIMLAANDVRRGRLSGGNVVFIHYVTNADVDDVGRLLIVIVDKKGVFDFDSELVPKKFESIDMDALRQAAMVDLTLFSQTYPANDGEPYLRFIEGKSSSNFFKSALGCGESVDNKSSVQQVVQAVEDFVKNLGLKRSERDKVTTTVDAFMEKKARDKLPIRINDIQAAIDVVLPEGCVGKGKFAEYVNSMELNINYYFEPTIDSIDKSSSVNISDLDGNFECRVRKSSIGSCDSDKPVRFTKDGEFLLIPVSGILSSETVKKLIAE